MTIRSAPRPVSHQRLGHAFPVLRPARALLARSPSAPALRSTNSAAGRPALFVGFTATTPGSDFSRPCISGNSSSPSRCGPRSHCVIGRTRDLPVPEQGASAHARVSDHAGPSGHSRRAPVRVAFHDLKRVGTQEPTSFAAQWLAVRSPADASPSPSRVPTHGSGPRWFRYAFLAVDSHHLLLAGLPAHSD